MHFTVGIIRFSSLKLVRATDGGVRLNERYVLLFSSWNIQVLPGLILVLDPTTVLAFCLQPLPLHWRHLLVSLATPFPKTSKLVCTYFTSQLLFSSPFTFCFFTVIMFSSPMILLHFAPCIQPPLPDTSIYVFRLSFTGQPPHNSSVVCFVLLQFLMHDAK